MLQVRKEKPALQKMHLETLAQLGLIAVAHDQVRRSI
jgi:hypothetical protein